MAILFTADTHFCHQNIIKFCNRPFGSIEQMNNEMKYRWNYRVKNNDIIYIVGDMFFRGHPEEVEEILSELNGKKILLQGNHDKNWLTYDLKEKYFLDVIDEGIPLRINDGQRMLLMCHYPQFSYKKERKTYMIHGHIHNDTTADFFPVILNRPMMFNAGVDVNHFVPVTFEEMERNNTLFKKSAIEKNK